LYKKIKKIMSFDFTIQAGANELGSRNTKHVISLQMLHAVKTHSHVRCQNNKFFLHCWTGLHSGAAFFASRAAATDTTCPTLLLTRTRAGNTEKSGRQ
jgi:hypothetical protein